MESIKGINLKQYAELISKTADATNEDDFWRIIESNGVTRADWIEAKDGWNQKIMAVENYLTVTKNYTTYLEQAVTEKNKGQAPCSLESYADISVQISYRKNPSKPTELLGFEEVMKENHLSSYKWVEFAGYWAPKVILPEYSAKYFSLFTQLGEKYQK